MPKAPLQLRMSKELVWKGSLSAAVGVVMGIIISLVVNCTLVEISLSPFFSVYFGVLFITVGSVILWRILGHANEEAQQRKKQLTGFAVMIVVSGLLCFVLERNWFVGLSPLAKVPLYTILGVSVAFALTFSVVDLINYFLGFLQPNGAKPLVESKSQVMLVLSIALVMGGLFGFIFGVMDVEDEVAYQIRLALLREEHYCYPIGALLGGLAGFGNEYLRQQEEGYLKLNHTEFDEDI
ncbi:unnamed protein product [Vitrella brassicaformis CCMP3155]|uniref:Uncharacterized protein n=2 Tax=Vitrella brassicaformis TaxID=1169539 RepID=A0A0G4EB83_VITBC|nr:unnamed protein product [Vitrella brassicaformis CCMP3155]|eukprot:CEL92515.1 unnamed protein product [Vitrella brassicaformis CCMP3155]